VLPCVVKGNTRNRYTRAPITAAARNARPTLATSGSHDQDVTASAAKAPIATNSPTAKFRVRVVMKVSTNDWASRA